ncbi:hypothetical protein [Streptomyces sp. PSAA01]|uniref:phage tail protein n=1 Tax=Streptomyces sp. PSAA01 TaxID=2912762 RepID=UPI001F2598CB|nr:hypothetical protein [Streptomyces sp. PSAA01]MCG0288585.1 hypothetical protein [Streptomyces sp. PSAA01]
MRGHEKKELRAATAQAQRLGAGAMGAIAAQRVRTGQQVGAGKGGAKSRDEEKRAQVTAILQGVFDTMKKEVEAILDGLDKLVDDQFGREEKAAREAFTAEHKRKMEEYKDRRYSGPGGPFRWTRDLFAGLPAEADKIFEQARDNYVRRMRQVISNVADTIGGELNRAKRRIAQGRTELQAAVRKLPADLRSIGQQAAAEFTDKFDELTQSVDDKGTQLVDTLATKYTDALKSVDDEIAAEKEKNKGLVAKAVDAVKSVINTIMELKRLLLSVLAKAASAVMLILKDPIGFLRNLVSAVGAGLKQFLANIGRHLQQGIMSWLLGKTAEAGIELPSKFDAQGVFKMLASVLGLTWQNIRARIVRKVPKMEPAVTAAETAVPLVSEVRKRGVAGMWDDLKARVGDLKKDLLDKVITYVTPTIIQAGIMWVLSLLNPASAFVRAVKLIIDIVRFIVTQARQIFEFVNAVLDAVIAIAKGGKGGVPGLIERALARSIPVLLGVLAAILGVGGIASRVKQIVQAMSKPVNRAVDWVIDKIVGLVKKLWTKIKSKFEKKKPKPKKRPKPENIEKNVKTRKQPRRKPRNRFDDSSEKKHKKSPIDDERKVGPIGEDLTWTVRTESHHLWIANTGRRHVPMMASRPHPVEEAIEHYRVQAKTLDPANENLASEITKSEADLNSLKSALAEYDTSLKSGATSATLDRKQIDITKAQARLRSSITMVQQLLGYDNDQRLQEAKDQFQSSPFSTRALGDSLGVSNSTAKRMVRDWKEKGVVFRVQSHEKDPMGMNTFDPAVAAWRETNPNNRHKYGYVNPSKTSSAGLEILSKGLLGSIGLDGAMKSATSSDKKDAAYHQQRAHYYSITDRARYPDFLFPRAILGHGPLGASEHWNETGHRQPREKNHAWNQQPSNYHGPEHEEESAASGSKAPRYELPTKERGSDESWWKHG